MNKLTPEEWEQLKNRFDYTLVISGGMVMGKPIGAIMDDLTGDTFRVALADKLLIEGLNATSYRIHTPMGHIDRLYGMEEKVWLQHLATKSFQLFLTNQENTRLKSKLLQAEIELAQLRAQVGDQVCKQERDKTDPS